MNAALFRPGTSDRNIWKSVVDEDEYRLPQMGPKDLCIDVGANTGAATYAMLQKGAGKVIAFEPDPDNFILFRKQLKQEIKDGRVEVYPLAVVGGSGFQWRTFSGVVQKDGEINHGGAFLFDQQGGDFGLGEYIVNRPFQVPCIPFDDIHVDPRLNLRLVKMDAESAEFEILNGISKWPFSRLPKGIVGEYHPHGDRTKDLLCSYLNAAGYSTEIVQHPNSELGLFFSSR